MRFSRTFFIFFIFAASTLFGADRSLLRVGIPPFKSENELIQTHKEIILHLQNELHMKVDFLVAKDYADAINKLKNGFIDVGFFTPNTYVEARESIPNLKYLATVLYIDKNGNKKEGYKSLLVSLKSSNIKTIQDIKGKRVGFTDEKSTSGYLFPRMLLKESGIDLKKDFSNVFMLKKHPKVLGALASGSIDVGATYEEIVIDAKSEYGDIFYIIAYSKEIPFDAVAAAPMLDEALAAKIQKALISYESKSPSENAPYGYTIKDDSFYEPVVEAKKLLEK